MDKTSIREYFDRHAADWDAEMIRSDTVIARILDNAGVYEDCRVLDVACGTGVLIPDYLGRGVESVTGVDISPEMARIAGEKFAGEDCVKILCCDAEELEENERYDCIVVYNAFPHFPEPERLIAKLSSLLAPGGRLTVAHGMSRAMIDSHHSGSASRVSRGLMDENALAEIFSKYLEVTVKISDDRMYQVVGIKN